MLAHAVCDNAVVRQQAAAALGEHGGLDGAVEGDMGRQQLVQPVRHVALEHGRVEQAGVHMVVRVGLLAEGNPVLVVERAVAQQPDGGLAARGGGQPAQAGGRVAAVSGVERARIDAIRGARGGGGGSRGEGGARGHRAGAGAAAGAAGGGGSSDAERRQRRECRRQQLAASKARAARLASHVASARGVVAGGGAAFKFERAATAATTATAATAAAAAQHATRRHALLRRANRRARAPRRRAAAAPCPAPLPPRRAAPTRRAAMGDPQVAAWLRCAGLSRFLPRFTAALVTPSLFLQLSSTDLDALGVDGPADRKRLTDLINELRRHAHLPPLAVMHARPERRPLLESLSDRNLPPAPSSASHDASSQRAHAKSALAASAAAARHALRPSSSSFSFAAPRVTVCVRKRPLSRKERAAHDRDVVTVNINNGSLCVHELREKVDLTKHVVTHPFSFDSVFNEHVSNPVVYENTAKPLVDTLFTGGRGTCFAYGQTGAGKTFTMAGDGAENPGLYTLAVRDVFDRIREMEADEWRVASEQGIEDFEPSDPPQVWISFYEIYASRLQDLLNSSSKLECREDGNNQVQIVGLAERLCEVEEDVLACIDEGSAARSTGVTGANDDSSRSHAVFQIELRHPPAVSAPKDASNAMREKLLRGSRPNQQSGNKGEEIGRLCFIDLAGSERGSDTANSTKQTRMEGAEINKSLLALKECIRAMDKKKDHTPFRGSKLTQVLKASFIGKNCKTVMIANISPASANVEHTLNTLRYSDRVKEIKKEKAHSPPPVESSRLGGRRATFSHGIGIRSGMASGSATPMKPALHENEVENKTNIREKLSTDRKSLPSQSRAHDVEILATPARGTKRAPPHRTAPKLRGRASDGAFLRPTSMGTDDEHAPIRQQRARTTRKRTPRAATMIPSRPSTGGTFLPRPPQRRKGGGAEKPLLRSNSMRVRSPSKSNVAVSAELDSDGLESTSDEASKSQLRVETRRTKVTRPQASTSMITRRRARELESRMAKEKKAEDESMVPDTSPDESEPDATNETVTSRRKPRSRNVAQSAMEFYGTQAGDDLSDEELLFASCDNLVDEATSAVQERLGVMVSDIEQTERRASSKMEARKGHASFTSDSKTSLNGGCSSASSSEETTPPPSFGRAGKTSAKDIKLNSVIRMHHVQIEELMRLTEADVSLVNAAEKGEIDAQEYSMKLALNLSQKMDLVTRLRDKLVLLE
ncbi:Kinesin [Gracilaria domingensis]|nr:Kinesin [Gracilaria domingensis]